jgi:hypothetical protein
MIETIDPSENVARAFVRFRILGVQQRTVSNLSLSLRKAEREVSPAAHSIREPQVPATQNSFPALLDYASQTGFC